MFVVQDFLPLFSFHEQAYLSHYHTVSPFGFAGIAQTRTISQAMYTVRPSGTGLPDFLPFC
jgi:hypothetical protein